MKKKQQKVQQTSHQSLEPTIALVKQHSFQLPEFYFVGEAKSELLPSQRVYYTRAFEIFTDN